MDYRRFRAELSSADAIGGTERRAVRILRLDVPTILIC